MLFIVYYKRYGKDILILVISIVILFISMYLDEYFKENIIENKFISLLNHKNYNEAINLLCESERKSLENNIIGKLNNFSEGSFEIYYKLIIKDFELKNNGYKNKVLFKYKNISGETIKDYFYIKVEGGKKCITKK